MAILRGFPPSNTISPSVRIAEKDLSFIAPEQTFHRAGLVGFASKGPINVPTVVRTQRELNTKFGQPHPDESDPYLIYAASQYLLIANELFIVRVAVEDEVNDERAQIASVDVPVSGSALSVVGSTDIAAGLTVADPMFFRWKLNGVAGGKTLTILPDTYTPETLVADLNSQLVNTTTGMDAGIEFFVQTSGAVKYLGVRSTMSFGTDATLEFVSVQNSLVGVGTVVGLGTGMVVAKTIGNKDRYGSGSVSAGQYNFSGVVAPSLTVVVDGTDNVNIDGVAQVIDLAAAGCTGLMTAANIRTAINNYIEANLPGGFEAYVSGSLLGFQTKHSGRDARILVKSDSTAYGMFHTGTLTPVAADGTACSGVVTDFGLTAIGAACAGSAGDAAEATFGLITGAADDTTNSFTLTADSVGLDGNSTQVRIVNNLREGTFNLDVYNNGVQVESWGNLTKDQSSRFYVESFLATVSDYIRATDNTATAASPKDGTYQLVGGTDGIPSDPDEADALLIGSPIGYSGMYAFSEPEQIEIDLLACPGHSSTAVVEGLIDVCQNFRMDCLAIIDPPFGMTVTEIVAWQNGLHQLNNHRFDSDFAALYWPWVKIRDGFNKIDVWVPPSGSVMAVIARSDSLAAPWFAPAGVNRGIVPGISDVFSRPTQEERDLMYGNRNCVNPIVQFSDFDGFLVWGQKTLQRLPTALDRINVRRMMFVIEKRIRAACRTLLFEPNDAAFRDRFETLTENILKEVQIGRGITAFKIQDDDTLNTPDVIDRNEFRARIGVQPTRAVEFIFLEFSVHRTGSFAESADTF